MAKNWSANEECLSLFRPLLYLSWDSMIDHSFVPQVHTWYVVFFCEFWGEFIITHFQKAETIWIGTHSMIIGEVSAWHLYYSYIFIDIILEEKTTYNVHIHICDEYSGPHSCMMRKKFPLKFRNIFLPFLVTIYIIKVKVLINREIKEGYSNAWWVKYLQEEGPQLLNQFW